MVKLASFATFATPGFSVELKEDHVNTVCSAEEFARWFFGEISTVMPSTTPDLYQEDFGWVIDLPIDQGSDVVMITVSYYEEDEDGPAFTCLAFDTRVSTIRATFNRSLKKRAATMKDEVVMKSAEILRSAKGVGNVQWWQDGPKAGDPMPNPWTRVETV